MAKSEPKSVDLRTEMSLKWCCLSGRSAVVLIFHDSGSNRRVWFLPFKIFHRLRFSTYLSFVFLYFFVSIRMNLIKFALFC
ncbi:predicted protein [Arabidopsis lyrata subsp. lyrata]|uniref:Predicted protein n=1 Tax=Arabidopsis lyrata subsp. lyrata TaxID=81972 RepID=D7M4V5_ARALL|nr:predicted protein [Arabidopsis lyrata subsp. lyrata]